MTKGIVFNIQRYSIHDGPGLRTTVFLKGCPLRCLWCHNPEGISSRPQLVYRDARCRHCYECVAVCPAKAISVVGGSIALHESACTTCGNCVTRCATGALEIVGTELEPEQVLQEIEKDRVFYDQSGGGVTFSGGEPLAQPEFLCEILRLCREREIMTAVDTSGYCPLEVIQNAAKLTDLILWDIKLVDNDKHKRFTGVSNQVIIDNLRQIAASNTNLIIRVPIIPGINDDIDNLIGIARLVSSLERKLRIDLLPYHSTAIEKYRRLSRPYALKSVAPPSKELMGQISREFERYGLTVKVGG